MEKSGVLAAVAFLSAAAGATVYRPGLVQAKFAGADIGFTEEKAAPLLTDLKTQAGANLDCTYGTFMANFSAGNTSAGFANAWSGRSWGWNDTMTLFAYEGEIHLAAGQTVAMVGRFDDGSAAAVNGVRLFWQGDATGYGVGVSCESTFTAPADGWYPLNAWVWDWTGDKNICGGYVSGVQYNLDGVTADYTDGTKWRALADDGKMSLLRVATDESFLTVYQVGTTESDLVVRLDAAGLPAGCASADVLVCWGAQDAGPSADGWDHVATAGTVTQATKDSIQSFTVAGAAGAARVRVCLSHIDPAASAEARVSSFADWSGAFTPQAYNAAGAAGVAASVFAGYLDDWLAGTVIHFGDGASSATVSAQFSATADFSGDVVETDSAAVSALGAPVLFDPAPARGRGIAFARLKIVNDLGVTAYSEAVPFAAPAIDFGAYAMRADFEVAFANADPADFQVLVRLSEDTVPGFLYADCAADGSDLAFFDTAGTVRYAFEIDTWNPAGESCVWVRLPDAAQGAKFAMCYGRAGQVSASDGAKVWNGFTGVWHLGEDAGLAHDSTGNGLDGRPTKGENESRPADEVMVAYPDGIVGRARVNATKCQYQGTYLSVPDYSSFGLGDTFTISGWFHATEVQGYPRLFSRKSAYDRPDGFESEISDGAKIRGAARGASDAGIGIDWPDLTANWMHLTLVYSGATLTAYVNGEQASSGAIAPATDNGLRLSFGSNSTGNEWCFSGQYDEIRLSKGAKSAARVAAEYANMSSPRFLRTLGAASTDPSMPVLSAADVTWAGGGTQIAYTLAGGQGEVYAVFTDEATGETYRIGLAESADASAGAVADVCAVPASALPAGAVYSWGVYAYSASLGRTSSVVGPAKYLAGPADPSVRYVSTAGSDANDGLTIATAMATPQAAVNDLGASGGTVYVEEGEYALATVQNYFYADSGLVVTTPVAIVGRPRDPAKVSFLPAAGTRRLFNLDNPGASLAYVTVGGGTANDGANGNVGAGTVSDCVITNAVFGDWNAHAALHVGGSDVRIVRTLFVGNACTGGGTGSALELGGGVAENCLFAANTCGEGGAAVRLDNGARLVNCTVAGNTGEDCAGVWANGAGTRAVNCAIFSNTARTDPTGHQHVWKGDRDSFAGCAADAEINAQCAEGPAGLRDVAGGDFTLTPVSCAIDAGVAYAGSGATSETDFAGDARVYGGAVDAGCYEWRPGAFDVDFSVSATYGLAPASFDFAAVCSGAAGPVTFAWDFNGDGQTDAEGASYAQVSRAFPEAGAYTVTLTATDGAAVRTVTKRALVKVAPKVLYADPANADGERFPYDTPETAATNLQDAIDAGGDGSTVYLADGFYVRSLDGNEGGFAVNDAIRLESLSGVPENCVLSNRVRAAWNNFDHRCLVLNNADAVAAGLTLAHGSYHMGVGGCLLIERRGGTVTNCVIRDGRADNWSGDGAAAYLKSGLVTHSLIEESTCAEQRRSELASLSINGDARVENCLIRNCKSDDNLNIVYVAGGAKLLNCTVVDSMCRADGYYNNEPTHYTGFSGVYAAEGSLVQNCAIFGVWRPDESDPEVAVQAPWRGAAASFVNCATDGAAPVNDTCFLIGKSAFTDYDARDYTPAMNGPLQNAGANLVLSSGTDLLGNPRVSGSRIDVGCYEVTFSGMMFYVR